MPTDPRAPSGPLTVRARRAVSVVFFMNGAVLASWIPHIPDAKQAHGLGDGTLGLVLLAMGAGAITAMPLAGRLIGRFGSRGMTTVAAIAFAATLPLPILSPSVPCLVAALFALGACNGTLDVSMNAHAVAVEHRYQRPIMSTFHALFSLGGLVGAAVAALATAAGLRPIPHVVLATIVAVGVMTLAVRGLMPTAPAGRQAGPVFALPSRALLGLGSLAFLGLLAEGSMADWSAVYLRETLATDMTTAAIGFAAFSLTMAAGRFTGDRLVARFGPGAVLRTSSLVAAVGLACGLLIGAPIAAIIGFGAVGFGIANIIPVLFSAAGSMPDVAPGSALAAVATTGYFGFLAGPALIGLTAELTTLSVGLAVVSAACAVIAASAAIVEPRTAPAVASGPRVYQPFAR